MESHPYDLALARPLKTSDGGLDRRRGFVVTVSHAGTTGYGEAAPLPGFTEPLDDCEAALESAATVAAESGVEAAADDLDADRTPAAAHAVTTALLDASARTVDQPLYRLLGGDERERVPVNATIGDGDRDETAAAASEAVEDGFETLKLKVGARDVSADIARVEAVRAAVGDDVDLRADANGAWSASEAETALEGIESLDLDYVEQPLDPADLSGHARLRSFDVPIALDESVPRAGLEGIQAANAADVIVLKPMALGSPARVYALATGAAAAGLGVTVSTTLDAAVGRATAVHLAASLETVRPSGLATADRLESDIAADPAPVEDGTVAVPQAPGLGIAEVTV